VTPFSFQRDRFERRSCASPSARRGEPHHWWYGQVCDGRPEPFAVAAQGRDGVVICEQTQEKWK